MGERRPIGACVHICTLFVLVGVGVRRKIGAGGGGRCVVVDVLVCRALKI